MEKASLAAKQIAVFGGQLKRLWIELYLLEIQSPVFSKKGGGHFSGMGPFDTIFPQLNKGEVDENVSMRCAKSTIKVLSVYPKTLYSS